MTRAAITDAATALQFMFAGNARVTILSKKTNKRFTYRVRVCETNASLWFVGLLTDSCNETDYKHIASCFGAKLPQPSRGRPMTQPIEALRYTLRHLRTGCIPVGVEIWHEGRCGRCGRPLTVPDSIASGFGPECVKTMQRKAA